MKSKLTIFPAFFLMLSSAAFSQAPNSFKYQSMVRKTDGSALVNQLVKVKISILRGSISGSIVYSEIHTTTSNTFGIVNLNIGEGDEKSSSISTIDWSADSYFVKVEMDETGGTNYTLSSVSQLLSVPYAINANSANSIDWVKIQNKPIIVSKTYIDSLMADLKNQLYADGSLSIMDIDGNKYLPIKIGNQIWLNENLKTKHYNNGEPIPLVTDDNEWKGLTNGAYCFYNNLDTNFNTYGCIYNFYAVIDSRNLCPSGWHVPTDDDLSELVTFVGGISGGGKLKEAGFVHWETPNDGADNSTGFSLLPSGSRDGSNGICMDINKIGAFWSSTEFQGGGWFMF